MVLSSRTEKEVLNQIKAWAVSNHIVRAVILTSSRVKPTSVVDAFSDYDIEIYVSDLSPFQQNDQWLEVLGPILVRWPYFPSSTSFDENFLTRLVLFKDYVRIDFQITANTEIEPDRYVDGYQVLIDKENLTTRLHQPTYEKYKIQMPEREAFEILVNEFWWDVTYVPKYLHRNELPYAKYMLDNVMRYEYLERMVEWYIGMKNNWSVNTGPHGKWFRKYLDEKRWSMLKSTYTGASRKENWEALFRFLELFRELAMSIADQLHYTYPVNVDREITHYCRNIHEDQ